MTVVAIVISLKHPALWACSPLTPWTGLGFSAKDWAVNDGCIPGKPSPQLLLCTCLLGVFSGNSEMAQDAET